MKVVLSQTLFANVATLPRPARSDAGVLSMKIPPPGVYPATDVRVADCDSNSWPPSGRNRALRAMRKAFALHIAGDQHLGSTVRYGVDDWGDAGYAMCVPSIANTFPRRWYPGVKGKNRHPGAPRNTGEFLDGFGNRVTVHAVSNPVISGREPAGLHDRAPGYGIARLHRKTREISLECWPRWADPSAAGAAPYPGWPVRFRQVDNYGRKPKAWLPELAVEGLADAVVQVVDEADGSLVYTLRIQGQRFRPWVFGPGRYTVRIGEAGTKQMKALRRLEASPHRETSEIRVKF